MSSIQDLRPWGKTAVSNHIDQQSEQHTLLQSTLFHLLPGVFIMMVFLGLSQMLRSYHLPPMLLFIGALPLALLPAELGVMYYLGWRRNGRLSLEGIVLYREPIAIKHYLWLVPLLFVLTVGLLIAISSFSEPIYQLFDWWPTAWNLDLDLTAHSKPLLLLTYFLLLIGAGIIAPIVEEFYFRGNY